MSKRALVHLFRETVTGTGQFVVACPGTKKCVIIDPVLNYDSTSCKVTTESADELLKFCDEHGYQIEWALDTHIHADHISATNYLFKQTGCNTGIGDNVRPVQDHFCKHFGLPSNFLDGKFWDRLLHDGDTIDFGDLSIQVMHTPGHTPADLSYYIPNDSVFVGDSIFMPDMGSARCDFPGGCVHQLWESCQRILSLPDDVRLFVGHDYEPNGRPFSVETTIKQQKNENIHLKSGTERDQFVDFRKTRDATLRRPNLLYPSIQFNMRGGIPPTQNAGAKHYFINPVTVSYMKE